MKPMQSLPLWIAFALLPVFAAEAGAQTVLLDQGVFRLSASGREIGRDSFDIRRTGSGEDARILAQGWVEFDGRRLSSIVETTGGHAFTAYQSTTTGAEETQVRARMSGTRLEVTVVSPAGEQTRELRARDGAVLLEENAPHQHYFMGVLARQGAQIPVISPRTTQPRVAEVRSIARETVTVGEVQLDASRIALSIGGVERLLWVDPEGRVLRLELPSTGFVAERLVPPR